MKRFNRNASQNSPSWNCPLHLFLFPQRNTVMNQDFQRSLWNFKLNKLYRNRLVVRPLANPFCVLSHCNHPMPPRHPPVYGLTPYSFWAGARFSGKAGAPHPPPTLVVKECPQWVWPERGSQDRVREEARARTGQPLKALIGRASSHVGNLVEPL